MARYLELIAKANTQKQITRIINVLVNDMNIRDEDCVTVMDMALDKHSMLDWE